MIDCILLAAGLSERFGSPKALAKIDRVTVLETIQTTLLRTQINQIIIVLGAHQERIKPLILNHMRIQFVYNKDYKFGQTSSFQCGLANLPEASTGVMLLPVDYPCVRSQTIDYLIEEFTKKTPSMMIPCYQNRKGHPPIFHSQMYSDLKRLDINLGINSVFPKHQHKGIIVEVDDPGVVATFNTQEEFIKIQELLQRKVR